MKTRYFNQIDVKDGTVHKISRDQKKLKAEYNWLSEVNRIRPELSRYIPRGLSYHEGGETSELTMKYYPEGDLGQRYLKETDNAQVQKVIEDCISILKDIFSIGMTTPNSSVVLSLMKVYVSKTIDRLMNNPFRSYSLNINGKDYERIFSARRMKKLVDRCISLAFSCPYVCLIHGDFFFSNILKDGEGFKVIDPRGDFGGLSIYGDPRYDLAKLRHSINGGYDYIINEEYTLKASEDEHTVTLSIPFKTDVDRNTEFFDNLVTKEFGFEIEDIKLIEALLFLTMIPLHSDDRKRQLAFMAIAQMKLEECGV